MEHNQGSHGEIGQSVDQFCQTIWDHYEAHPEMMPVEVTINNVGTGILAKVDEEGLFFEANGDEFDLDEFFMENNFQSDVLSFKHH